MTEVTTFGTKRPKRSALSRQTATPGIQLPADTCLLSLFEGLLGEVDVDKALHHFHRWAIALELVEGVVLKAPPGAAPRSLGESRHHSASYTLVAEQQELGSLTVSRRTRFREEELALLERALGGFARTMRASLMLQRAADRALRDGLTGALNRRALEDQLPSELARARRHGKALTLMVLDIDHFKDINDRLGHLAGDDVLRTLADTCRASIRESDLLYRLGGDEFAILLPHTGLTGGTAVAQTLRRAVEQLKASPAFNDTRLEPRISIGVTDLMPDDDEQSLLQRADTLLYHAKAQGRGRVCSGI